MGLKIIHVRAPLALLCAALWAPVQAVAAVSYDLAGDWSTTANPDGAWTYRQGGAALPLHAINVFGIAGWNGWVPGGSAPPPAWLLVTAPAPGADAAPGDVVVHSTNFDGAPASVTWTSPAAGLVDISGQAWDVAHDPGRDDEWTLSLGAATLAYRASIVGVAKDSAAADFAGNLVGGASLSGLAIGAGEQIVFTVQQTQGSFGHFSGVDLSVEFTPVPVPGALWLLLAPAALMMRCRRPGG